MIDIPKNNPVLFRPLTGQTAVNFDNQFIDDYKAENRTQYPFAQLVDWSDWQIQVVADYDARTEGGCDIQLVQLNHSGGWAGNDVTVTQVGDLFYYTFDMRPDMSIWGCFKFFLILYGTNTVLFESEWVRTEADVIENLMEENQNLRRFEWFNNENALGCEFPLSGFVGCAWLECKLTYWQPGGDITMFDNLGEDVKLREIAQRVMKLELEAPAYLCEQLRLWMSNDNFFINDVLYTNAKVPAITQIGTSSQYRLEVELTQSDVIGINTHDTGFDCDTAPAPELIEVTMASEGETFIVPIPAGYQLHVVSGKHVSGDYSVWDCGYSAGANDIFNDQNFASGDKFAWLIDTDFTSSAELFFTLNSGTATVTFTIQFIAL